MLRKLIELMPPPDWPVGTGDAAAWRSAEAALRCELPDDYKQFIDLYGSGLVGAFLCVWSPFAANPNWNLLTGARQLRVKIRRYIEAALENGRRNPDAARSYIDLMLPFADTDNGDLLYWYVGADVEPWPIVVCDRHAEVIEAYDLSMSDFLIRMLTADLHASFLRDSCFDANLGFIPLRDD